MPFKSKAQQGYMNAAAARGDIEQSVVDEFNEASKGKMKNLPQHVKTENAARHSEDCHKGKHSDDAC